MERVDILSVEIELKSDITGLYTPIELDGETKKLAELIEYDSDLDSLLGTKVNAKICLITEYDALVALVPVSASECVYVHPSWIKTIDGKECAMNTLFVTKTRVKINPGFMLDTVAKEILDLSTLKVCAECGEPLDLDGYHLCSSCLQEEHFKILNYSHVPEYKFFGEQKGKLEQDHPAWYGLELEYGLPKKLDMAKLVYNADEKEGERSLYLKSDSSIDGGEYRAEMVTHPMSYDYLMSAKWLDNLQTLNADDRPNSNGCHIHISRTAFKHDKAFNKFKYLLLANKKVLELVAGRTENNYAQFRASDSQRVSTKDKIIGEKRAAINQAHKHTIECRFMASSDNPDQVRRYIQFLDSMVKYTSYHANTASYDEYVKYVTKYKVKYAIIYKFIQENLEAFSAGQVVIKTYSKKIAPIGDLKVGDFSGICRLIFKDKESGEVLREETNIDKHRRVYFQDGSDDKIQSVFGHDVSDNEDIFVEYTSA